MYKVYVNGKMIFNDLLPDEDLVLVKPKLILEDNEPGSIDFTFPNNHRFINDTNEFGRPFCGSTTDTITVYKNDEWLWEGRPVSETSDFYDRRTIHCEGALAYFKDTIQPLASCIVSSNLNTCVFNFLQELADNHNNQLRSISNRMNVDLSNRMIYVEDGVSIINVTPKDISTFSRITNYETTLESINKRLINKLGGHIRIRRVVVNGVSKLILDYLSDYPNASGQKIEFGKNLLDYNKSTDLTEIATVIIPRGDTVEEGSPFYRTASVFSDVTQRVHLGWLTELEIGTPSGDQRIYANEEVIKEYGYIEQVVDFENVQAKYSSISSDYNDLSGWSSIEAYRNALVIIEPTDSLYKRTYLHALKVLGENYISNLQFDKLELELSVFDLSYLGVGNVQDFKLLDNVICSSKPHGMINKSLPIKKMEIVLNDPEDLKITIGDTTKKSISVTAGMSASIIEEDPGDYNDYYKGLLIRAKLHADSIIEGAANGLSNGYLTIIQKTDQDDSRYSDGIIISNERILPTEMTSGNYISGLRTTHPNMKMWVWNSGGLGYYDLSQGVNKLVTAITNDGKIVADAITTGTLTAITVDACTLTGCTFRCENSLGYYVRVADGKIFGGKNNLQYGYIDATASVTDMAVSGHPTYNGIKISSDVIALDTTHLVIKNPDINNSEYGGQYYTNAATVTLKNAAFSINGNLTYGDLVFIEGLLIGYPSSAV